MENTSVLILTTNGNSCGVFRAESPVSSVQTSHTQRDRLRTNKMTEGPHNPGQDLDLAWLEEVKINLPAVLRRAATYGTRRTVKQQWQAAWLLRAVTCIDLTTLAGDDTETNVARLCLKAARPIRKDLLQVTIGERFSLKIFLSGHGHG